MKRKEALIAVIGGVVGAVLVMAVGSFAPLGAQSDTKFGRMRNLGRSPVASWL